MSRKNKLEKFRTDSDGNFVIDKEMEELYRNATYILDRERRPAVGRLKDHEHVAQWIRDAVIGDLETLNGGIEHRSNNNAGGANFLLFAGCMLAIEYLANVYSDPNQSTRDKICEWARHFMKNGRYVSCMPILLSARNGLIHGSWPARVKVDNRQVPFAVGYDYPRNCVHLTLTMHQASDEPAPIEKLFVNPREFLADLRDAVLGEDGGMISWLLDHADNQEILERAQPIVIGCTQKDLDAWAPQATATCPACGD